MPEYGRAIAAPSTDGVLPDEMRESVINILKRDHDQMVAKGVIPPGEPEIKDGGIHPAYEITECAACGATGEIENDEPCPECEGDGYFYGKQIGWTHQLAWYRYVEEGLHPRA